MSTGCAVILYLSGCRSRVRASSVTGTPNYRLHLDLWDPTGKQQRPALFGTAMYSVNAIPAVCD
ncbi:MAG: hypothetical protein ACRDTK_05880, partial [Mycobacterium sp.]